MAERPRTSHKPRPRVQHTDNEEVQLPEDVSFPLVPTHDMNAFPDTESDFQDIGLVYSAHILRKLSHSFLLFLCSIS